MIASFFFLWHTYWLCPPKLWAFILEHPCFHFQNFGRMCVRSWWAAFELVGNKLCKHRIGRINRKKKLHCILLQEKKDFDWSAVASLISITVTGSCEKNSIYKQAAFILHMNKTIKSSGSFQNHWISLKEAGYCHALVTWDCLRKALTLFQVHDLLLLSQTALSYLKIIPG